MSTGGRPEFSETIFGSRNQLANVLFSYLYTIANAAFMNTELFIARRLFSEKENRQQLSKRIINIALAGIALGMAIMLIAVAVIVGFKKEVSDKVTGFGSHIQVVNYDSNLSFETRPVSSRQPFLPQLLALPNIRSVNIFATKPGIIKTDDYIQGVVLKGVSPDYPWDFFHKHLIEGKLPDVAAPERTGEVLISKNNADKLLLKCNDPLFMFFINENENIPRVRQFKISGIYNTNLQEFDDLFVVGDIRQVQHINGWEPDQISGFEITVEKFSLLETTEQQVRECVISYDEEPGTTLRTVSILRKYPQIFDWLSVLDMNVWVLLTLMILVAGFNMISALLVLILERSNMIGIMKALGSRDSSVRKIFLYLSGFLISRGLIWGNMLGIVLLLLQKYLNILKLDPSSYYMDVVPVHLSVWHVLLLNAGAMTVTLLMLIIPSFFVSKISPDKIIRFD